MTELLLPTPFRRLDTTTDWRSVNKYVNTNYKPEIAKKVQSTFDKMNELRKSVANTCTPGSKQPPTEAFVETTLKEYAKLVALAQLHLPLTTGEIKGLSFNWIDLADGKQRNSPNSNAELIGLVVDMAASSTTTAAHEGANKNVDGIKNAFKLYSAAAGLFEWVPQLLNRLGTNEVVGDLNPNVFSTMAQYCLASGHHCSYLKAEIEMGGKHSVLSKLAAEANRQYAIVEQPLKALNMKGQGAQLVQYVSVASNLFAARAAIHLAQEELAKEELGTALGRLQEAATSLAAATHAAGSDGQLGAWVNSVAAPLNRLTADAKNKNDTVFFARVVRDLPPPPSLGRCMAKSIVPEKLLAWPAEESNPFKEVVPLHVSKVVSDFRTTMNAQMLEASAFVQSHRDKIRHAVGDLGITAVISSAVGGDNERKIPASLRKKITALRTDGDGNTFKLMDTLVNMVGHVANTISAVERTLDQIQTELQQEVTQDHSFLQMYGEKVWYSLRQPSEKLPDYQSLQKIILELRGATDGTLKQPNEKLKVLLNENLRDLSRLDWSMEDLDALMPYSKTKAARELSSQVQLAVEKLKGALDRFDQLESEETAILKELSQMLSSEQVTTAIAAVPPERHSEVLDAITAEFNGRVTSLRSTVEGSDQLLEECQENMMAMAEVKSDDPIADEVQRISSGLENACSLYQSFHRQLGDLSGTASSLMDRTESSLSLAQSYTLGRSVEAEDFKNSLDAQLAAKMKEVQMQRSNSDEINESRQRQDELAKQIAALEAERAIRGPSSSTSNGGQPGSIAPPAAPQQAAAHPLDTMAREQSTGAMDALFGNPNPSANGAPSASAPYVYQPTSSAPPQQQPMYGGATGSYQAPPPQQQQQPGAPGSYLPPPGGAGSGYPQAQQQQPAGGGYYAPQAPQQPQQYSYPPQQQQQQPPPPQGQPAYYQQQPPPQQQQQYYQHTTGGAQQGGPAPPPPPAYTPPFGPPQ